MAGVGGCTASASLGHTSGWQSSSGSAGVVAYALPCVHSQECPTHHRCFVPAVTGTFCFSYARSLRHGRRQSVYPHSNNSPFGCVWVGGCAGLPAPASASVCAGAECGQLPPRACRTHATGQDIKADHVVWGLSCPALLLLFWLGVGAHGLQLSRA